MMFNMVLHIDAIYRRLVVIDTPGVFYTRKDVRERFSKIKDFILAFKFDYPRLNAILLDIKIDTLTAE